jgi:hypothetical protein
MWNDLSHFLLVQLKEFGITIVLSIIAFAAFFLVVEMLGRVIYHLLKK